MRYVAHLDDDGSAVYVSAVYPELGQVTYLGVGAELFDTLDQVAARWPGVPLVGDGAGLEPAAS